MDSAAGLREPALNPRNSAAVLRLTFLTARPIFFPALAGPNRPCVVCLLDLVCFCLVPADRVATPRAARSGVTFSDFGISPILSASARVSLSGFAILFPLAVSLRYLTEAKVSRAFSAEIGLA